MEKPEHIMRMESERDILDDRIEKAEGFLLSPKQNVLTRMQVLLLHTQLDAMKAYSRILNTRIEYDSAIHENDMQLRALAVDPLGAADER